MDRLILGRNEILVSIQFYFLAILLLIASYFDIKTSKIPNWLTMSGIAVGLLLHLIQNGVAGLSFSAIGLLVGGGVFMILYFFRALGAGDVKLFAAIGALVGTEFVLYSMMYSIVYAGVIGLIILLFTRSFMKRMLQVIFYLFETILSRDTKRLSKFKRKRSIRFPFMYAALPGVITTYCMFII